MKYERVKYPDGQISVKFKHFERPIIEERINSYEDLIFVKSIAEVLDDQNVKASLFIPCLFAQRSDRRFESGQSFDLKVVADIINSCHFENVSIFDPHSDVSLALINHSHKITPYVQVERSIKAINNPELVLVSPDAGAYKKVFDIGKEFGVAVVAANKFRELSGRLELNFLGDVRDKECLIVDDFCDGGYTFILLADALKKQGATKVSLYVSHGLFSKGFGEMSQEIDHIYCTNSIKNIDTTSPAFIEAYPTLTNFITQYKVI